MKVLEFLRQIARGSKEIVGKEVEFQWDKANHIGQVGLDADDQAITGIYPGPKSCSLSGKMVAVTDFGDFRRGNCLIVKISDEVGQIVTLKNAVLGLVGVG